MATEMKYSVTCDRCKRVELRDEPPTRPPTSPEQFTATMRTASGKEHTVTIGDLCGPCENTVMNLLGSISKKVEKKSPNRTGAKKP